jgi:hypothetical protein
VWGFLFGSFHSYISRRKTDAGRRYLVIEGSRRGTQHGRSSSIMCAVIEKRLRQYTEGWRDVESSAD